MRALISKASSWWRSLIDGARDATGQTLAEYSILVTAVALGLTLLALLVFRDTLAGAFDSVAACLDGSC
jgi:Flp pilus assembly pilin Flp